MLDVGDEQIGVFQHPLQMLWWTIESGLHTGMDVRLAAGLEKQLGKLPLEHDLSPV